MVSFSVSMWRYIIVRDGQIEMLGCERIDCVTNNIYYVSSVSREDEGKGIKSKR